LKVLIIEDDPNALETISLAFEIRWPGTAILPAADGRSGLRLVRTEYPDVVILDLGLPDIDGMEVLKEIRSFSDVPILIVTARGEQTSKLRGLELGSDDYIVKPFDPLELLTRVKAILRRASGSGLRPVEKPFACGDLTINFASREVTLKGQPLKLTPTEYDLLCHLATNEGRVLSHRTLLEKVWGAEYVDSPDFVKKYVYRLRQKIGDDPQNPTMILSERGVGYRLVHPTETPNG